MICCNCGGVYNPYGISEEQEGFCSRWCLDRYLKQIDTWFEHLRAKMKAYPPARKGLDG
jgi:hypothetical protein